MAISDKFFCSDQSSFLGEELIGTAVSTEVYILIEYRTPWAREAFESKDIPQRLRLIVDNYRKYVHFLLISNNKTKYNKYIKIIFYIRSKNLDLCNGFIEYTADCSDYEHVCEIIENYLISQQLPSKNNFQRNRNILICTHGLFDQCCGKYGKPFYINSNQILDKLSSYENITVWESSHFKGHRFAPTMIDFPNGRYYGRLSEEVFIAIMNRTGDLNKVASSYRGWAILPKVAQIVEKQLFLDIGWQWFNASIISHVDSSEDSAFYNVKIKYLLGNDEKTCFAQVSKNISQPLTLKIRCQNQLETVLPQFYIDSFKYL